MMRSRVLGAAFVALALASAPAASQTCPQSAVKFGTLQSGPEFPVDAASFDSTFQGTYRVTFDIPGRTGILRHCCSINPTYMRVVDRYDVTGVPLGTPVGATVELSIAASASISECGSGCDTIFEAMLVHGATSDEIVFGLGCGSSGPCSRQRAEVLQLPVTITAGTPATIVYELHSRRAPGGGMPGVISGELRFSGLPAGVSVVSCHEPTVPVHQSTWGTLKSMYR